MIVRGMFNDNLILILFQRNIFIQMSYSKTLQWRIKILLELITYSKYEKTSGKSKQSKEKQYFSYLLFVI